LVQGRSQQEFVHFSDRFSKVMVVATVVDGSDLREGPLELRVGDLQFDRRTLLVVVGDNDQVVVTFPIGDCGDSDAPQSNEVFNVGFFDYNFARDGGQVLNRFVATW
jgi:hypothetical protein